MIEDEVLELLHTRLITLELIVSEIHENLIDKGLIDKDEFNKSLDVKIKRVKEITDLFKDDNDDGGTLDDINIPNIFGGPIGEA